MFYVYILRSISSGKYYIGQSENPERRLEYHNTLEKGFTARYRPWELVWKRCYDTRSEAIITERKIKSWKSHTRIEELVNGIVDI
jgi:putative endonuclease